MQTHIGLSFAAASVFIVIACSLLLYADEIQQDQVKVADYNNSTQLLVPQSLAATNMHCSRIHRIRGKKIHTRLIMFMPTPAAWTERRRAVTQAFTQQAWPSCMVHAVYILGTRHGANLQYALPTKEVMQDEMVQNSQIDNLHYLFSPCRDKGDEWDNPNGTSSTTCKTYHGFKFAAQHFDAEYVWRSADDAYLNLQFFFRQVAPALKGKKALYFGSMRDATVNKPLLSLTPDFLDPIGDLRLDSQPNLQRHVWRMRYFGSYMFGMGFMVTMDVAQLVDSWTIPPQQTWCEDVVIGAWLMPFQIEWMDANLHGWHMHDRNVYLQRPETCSAQLLVHYVQKSDWNNIEEESGNMQFCFER